MSKEREKVTCKTELEFITEVADDCVVNLKDKDRKYIINNPYAIDYHFSYCLYIRNHYIHNKDFSDVDFWAEPDYLSSEIIATVYKGNIIKNLIMDCQSYTKYRPNETTGGIFVSWRRKEELPTGA